ncbi:MAG TPA: hypothetical protein VNT79_13910 [Phycisphaerae bacterium]|nr:hypothetical protein [Phycisphaerae bacterium]
MFNRLKPAAFFLPLLLIHAAGCAVPQPRGDGMYKRVVEPRNNAVYHLYLPVDYVKNNGRHPLYPRMKRWPLVMTFHGMKPYDNARPQEREWEKQADIYGYVVCAPELATSNSFMEYPLTKEHSYVLKDRDNVMAIMDHVFETTMADPGAVLSTSWSCGGYLAHYFPNRFPERFTCIATRLSNFGSKLLVEETVPRYRDRTSVAVFIGDGDLPKCKSESEAAVAWYMSRNFRVVRGKMIDDMGHKRIPQTAAAFFAEQVGVTPLDPVQAATTIAKVRMQEYYPPPELLAKMSPPVQLTPSLAAANRSFIPPSRSNPVITRSSPARQPASYTNTTAGRNYPFDRGPSAKSPVKSQRTSPPATDRFASRPSPAPRETRSNPASNSNPARDRAYGPARPAAVAKRNPPRAVNIRIKGPSVGSSPYYLSYGVDLPPDLTQGADFLWRDNEAWIGDEADGQKILETAGTHKITVVMVTRDNVEYRGLATVQVLDRSASAAGSASR